MSVEKRYFQTCQFFSESYWGINSAERIKQGQEDVGPYKEEIRAGHRQGQGLAEAVQQGLRQPQALTRLAAWTVMRRGGVRGYQQMQEKGCLPGVVTACDP